MMTTESSQPEDYSGLVEAQDKGRNYLFYIVIIAFVLVLVWFFTAYSPEQEIELEAPLSQEQIDPVIRAQIEASKQSVTAGISETQRQAEVSAAISSPEPAKPATTSPLMEAETTASSADAASLAKAGMSAGETARLLINLVRRGEKDLSIEQLYGQASEFHQQAKNTDAYLLYFYNARKGHGPSAFELAKMHDPAYFQGVNELLDSPDPMQAYKWYTIAVESNVAGAEQKLQALRSSIEAAAKGGDLSAQRLLLNWK